MGLEAGQGKFGRPAVHRVRVAEEQAWGRDGGQVVRGAALHAAFLARTLSGGLVVAVPFDGGEAEGREQGQETELKWKAEASHACSLSNFGIFFKPFLGDLSNGLTVLPPVA